MLKTANRVKVHHHDLTLAGLLEVRKQDLPLLGDVVRLEPFYAINGDLIRACVSPRCFP
jgi:hypothetical protein